MYAYMIPTGGFDEDYISVLWPSHVLMNGTVFYRSQYAMRSTVS